MKAGPPIESLGLLEARIGYTFRDRDLLIQALTHMSHAPAGRTGPSYQRLEFLGDHVLGLVVSAMLFDAFPQAGEGELSRRLAGLVRKETCADVGAEWNVSAHIRVGSGEAQSGNHAKPAIMSDVCEAIIGALYIDGGYDVASAAVTRAWMPRMLTPNRPLRDPKTSLQEWAQGLGRAAPLYREVKRQGPAHAPHFTVAAEIEGFPPASGTGASKRAAEQAAAQEFMVREGIVTAVSRD